MIGVQLLHSMETPMKKAQEVLRLMIVVLFPLASHIGCKPPKPITPTISSVCISNNIAKYNKIAIMNFTNAPNYSTSGEVVSALASQCFAQSGFTVIERNRFNDLINEQKLSNSGIVEDGQAIKLGKMIGVDAIVVGVVGQYSMIEKHTDTTYQTQVITAARVTTMPDGSWVTVPAVTQQIAIQGTQWTESYVSVSLRVLDVESGQLLYSGSGQYDQGIRKPPQMLAEEIIRGIVAGWTAH